MAALLEVQRALPAAEMNKQNPHLKSKYADLNSVQAACRPLLLQHGLVATHTSRDNANGSITVILQMTHAETGESITSEVTMTPTKNTPQEMGSCLTYGRRYTLAAMVGIVADEDDDGHSASKTPKPVPVSGLTAKKAEVNRLLRLLPKESKERGSIAGEARYLEENKSFTESEADKIIERLTKLVNG
jgi:hypothetical protein